MSSLLNVLVYEPFGDISITTHVVLQTLKSVSYLLYYLQLVLGGIRTSSSEQQLYHV